MLRPPPRSTRTYTLFPYPTLCRAPAILPHPTGSIRPLKSFKLFVMVPGSSLLPATAFRTRDQVEAAAVDLVRVDRQADQRSQRRHDVHRHHRIGLFERGQPRSDEHTSELQSLMRISYAVF